MPVPPWRRWIRRIWIAGGLGFMAWLWFGLSAEEEAVAAWPAGQPGPVVLFEPKAPERPAGLVFLPGGLVDPRAYAPPLREIASRGYRTVLIELPWRSAFNESQAKQLFQEIDQVVGGQRLNWILAGHSRGAMWAARYAHRTHGNRLAGLALIGTSHPRDVDLSHLTIPVSKILGTEDRVAPLQASRDRSHLLPQQTKFVEIAGANHTQFAFYHWQLGDGAARISRPQQQRALTNALLELLEGASPMAR